MNKQLLRLKRRSDDGVLNVAECDDNDNLYVNVGAGTITEVEKALVYAIADGGGGVIAEVPLFATPEGKLYIDSVEAIGEVTQSNSYGENFSGSQRKFRVSNSGYTLTKDVQSALEYDTTHIFGPWPDSAVQYTGFERVYPIPTTHDIGQKYIVYCANPSPDTALTMSIRNEVDMFGGTVYGQLGQNGTSGVITVPAATYQLFSGTAWSSCFTSIGAALTDESGDLNDANGPDVPFAFTAVDDAIYFGNTYPFQRMRINTGTAGVYVASGIWEYWNGSAWTQITTVFDTTNTTVTDGTQPFKRTGSRYIQWQVPSDWTAYDIAGDPTSQYWVRFRVTSFTSLATPPSLQQGYYKRVGQANVHGYLIEGLWNGGDCKVTLENATAVPAGSGFQAEVYIKRL